MIISYLPEVKYKNSAKSHSDIHQGVIILIVTNYVLVPLT